MSKRGFSIIEVMTSLALLGIATLGLVASMLLASGGTALSRTRTHMMEFAQTRIERVASRTRVKVPTAATTTPVNCSAMAASGTFDPNAAPGTGGWMLDVIDGTPPDGTTSAGDDLMFGPLLVEGDLSGIDRASTLTKRTNFAAAWTGGTDTAGCGSATVTKDPTVMCREIHIEPADVTVSGTTTYMLRVWVRVVRGGGSWKNGYVLAQEDIAQ